MKGYVLLADGLRLDGTLRGAQRTAFGWVAANTAVVGFQEMVTDPAYKDRILVFTYPEIGNVGVIGKFSESPQIQAAGLVCKVLSECRSHYLSEDSLENALTREGVPCLTDIDTRGLAVHLRENGEMVAAVAPESADPVEVRRTLETMSRPVFKPSESCVILNGQDKSRLAVINLGVRASLLQQLSAHFTPMLVSYNASASEILDAKPKAVFVSDGPSAALPPAETVETIKALFEKVPMLACGLGHVALGMALGCKATFLRRGHHGANYPAKNIEDGKVEVTEQRHTVTLDRPSVLKSSKVKLLWENINDESIEGIRAANGLALGLQSTLAPPQPGIVNGHIKAFADRL